MTLAELRATVADALRTPIDDTARLTTARVDRALNRGYARFAREAGCFQRTLALTATGARVALPADVLRVREVLVNGTPLTAETGSRLEVAEPGWRVAAPSAPRCWLGDTAGAVTLHPAPASATALTIAATVTPSDVDGGVPLLVAATDAPQLPYYFQLAPALAAIAELGAYYFADDPALRSTIGLALQQFGEMAKQYRADLVTEGAYRG